MKEVLHMPEQMTNEQLLAEIDRLLAGENPEETDAARLEACLVLLQQRCPVLEDYDAQQAKVRLQNEHPELFPRHRRTVLWRFLPLAAALALLLAICAGAYSFSSGWFFRYEKNQDPYADGDRYAVTSVDYGGSKLPEETEQKIRDNMVLEAVINGSRYTANFTFATLAELEDFVGIDLVESDRYSVSNVHCTAYFYNRARETFSIQGFYTLCSGEYFCRVRFYLSTYPDASLSTHHLADETSYHFTEYPMDNLDINAAILTNTEDKTDLVAYWKKDRLAYELRGLGTQNDLEHLQDVLDHLN